MEVVANARSARPRTMQPTEPESTHAPEAPHTVSVEENFAAKQDDFRTEVPMVGVVPGDPATADQLQVLKEGHDRPGQGLVVVPNGDIEKGSSTFSRPVSVHTLWEHVRTPSIAAEDVGKGYDDWLKLEKLQPPQYPLAIAKHSVKQLSYVFIIAIPAILMVYLFSLLVREAVEEWHHDGVPPLQKDPIIAGLIGEPFHHLSPGLLYSTFIALAVMCPFLCCQTKMFFHPLCMYGRQLIPLWKTSLLMGCIMAVLALAAAITMHTGQVHVPRIAWMGVVFVALFSGLFLCSRHAAKILGFPGFTLLYFRASFVANVLLYLYAVFFPFWFFGTTSVGAKLFLAIGFHPMVEFGQAFLWQHTAVYLRYNDPSTSIYPGFHYACLFALYGAFLLVNFAELWQNILGFTLLRLWTIVCKVFAQELTYFTYLSVLRKTPEEAAEILSSVRFKRYRNDVINSGAIVESVTIIVAGAVTFLFKFNKSPDGEVPATTSFSETALLVFGQVMIGMLCDALADLGLSYRGAPWHQAWQTKQKDVLWKFCHIVFVSVGMFLFYFYPFLASKMVLGA